MIKKGIQMNNYAEILKYTLPALTVLIVAWFMLKAFVDGNRKNIELIVQLFDLYSKDKAIGRDKKLETNIEFNRLQLQAYERMTLFLERINLANIVPRLLDGNKTALQFQRELLQTIRQEYEHNLSQQIYISETSWELIKAAKENVIQLINSNSKKIDNTESSMILAKTILTSGFEKGKDPVEKALAALKFELKKKYG